MRFVVFAAGICLLSVPLISVAQDDEFGSDEAALVYAAATEMFRPPKATKLQYSVNNYQARKFDFFPNSIDRCLRTGRSFKKKRGQFPRSRE